jgi:hypothetical protein
MLFRNAEISTRFGPIPLAIPSLMGIENEGVAIRESAILVPHSLILNGVEIGEIQFGALSTNKGCKL